MADDMANGEADKRGAFGMTPAEVAAMANCIAAASRAEVERLAREPRWLLWLTTAKSPEATSGGVPSAFPQLRRLLPWRRSATSLEIRTPLR